MPQRPLERRGHTASQLCRGQERPQLPAIPIDGAAWAPPRPPPRARAQEVGRGGYVTPGGDGGSSPRRGTALWGGTAVGKGRVRMGAGRDSLGPGGSAPHPSLLRECRSPWVPGAGGLLTRPGSPSSWAGRIRMGTDSVLRASSNFSLIWSSTSRVLAVGTGLSPRTPTPPRRQLRDPRGRRPGASLCWGRPSSVWPPPQGVCRAQPPCPPGPCTPPGPSPSPSSWGSTGGLQGPRRKGPPPALGRLGPFLRPGWRLDTHGHFQGPGSTGWHFCDSRNVT